MSPIKDGNDYQKQDLKIIKNSMEEDEMTMPKLQNKAKPSLIS